MRAVSAFLDLVEKLLRLCVAALFVVMVSSIFYQVILRYAFASANAWSEELARYTFVWQVMLAAAIGVRKARHMQIDFFVNLLPGKSKTMIVLVMKLVAVWFFYVLAVEGHKLFELTHRQQSTGLAVPMSWVYLAIPVGAVLMIIFTVEDIATDFFGSGRGKSSHA